MNATATDPKVKTVSFIATLAAILSGQMVKKSDEPRDEVGENEEVHGVLEDPVARSLYCLRSEIARQSQVEFPGGQDEVGKKIAGGGEMARKIEERLDDLGEQAQLAGDIFWRAVGESFPAVAVDGDSIGVRKGWQVVTFKRKRPEPIVRVIELVLPKPFVSALHRQ